MRWKLVYENPIQATFQMECGNCGYGAEFSAFSYELPQWDVGSKPTVRCRLCGKYPHLPGPRDRWLDLHPGEKPSYNIGGYQKWEIDLLNARW